MSKIELIEIKDMEVVQNEQGEFIQVYKNSKKIPCIITNHAMKKAKDLGLINSSLLADILKLHKLEDATVDGEVNVEAFEHLDELSMQKTIYIGCIGANKNLGLDFDEFLEKFHYTTMETIEAYMKIIEPTLSNDPNLFAEALRKSTSTEKKA